MADPYNVLQVSPTASDEEVKRAYRVLSRKYHPDANINNPDKKEAEERFKEIQQAYQDIMNEREAAGKQGTWDSGFGSFSGGRFYNESDSDVYNMHLMAAGNFLQKGYFKEADNVLRQMEDRDGMWYYFSAVANSGMGNNIMALEHAKTAVLLDPGNADYQRLVAQLEAGRSWYKERQKPYQMNQMDAGECCMQFCYIGVLCNLCCGGSYYCNGGYGTFCC
ncbi:molecular chaperone DnaJ [bacterium D16-51]|nr:molecular chaperone DnaJ [bacterium D16-59]RKI61049.1 molecular chaperone DnaJ [bacterium D16-51]